MRRADNVVVRLYKEHTARAGDVTSNERYTDKLGNNQECRTNI